MHRAIGTLAVVVVLVGCGESGGTLPDEAGEANVGVANEVDEAAVAVPDVVGRTSETAVAVIEDSDLQAEVIELDLDDAAGAEPGSIVSQTPDANVIVEPGSIVVLRAAPGMLEVPDVVGLAASTAEQELRDLGLEVARESVTTADRAPGEVHRLEPRSGTPLEPGARVTLFIAEEPPPPEPSTHTVTVRFEMWTDWYAIDGSDRCAGSMHGFRPEMRRGQAVALLGPDQSELSAVLLDDGFVEESLVGDEREVPPATGVCAWELSFPDVPEVATYRLDLPYGQISGSTSLSQARRARWDLGIWW